MQGLARTVLLALSCCSAATAAFEVAGIAQLSLVAADDKRSFIDSGTGALRYDDNGAQLQQALLHVEEDLSSAFSAELVLNYYPDGDRHLGVTQALLNWKPLSAKAVRFRGRAGFFYPRMSAENADTGWLSPYSYTPSAINSWIGEELRTAGAELSMYSAGRARRSPWTWELTGAIFGWNDPAGSLISWRGFATHDRQSIHNDRVQFAPYPSVVGEGKIRGPAWVEPFREIDDRPGGYLGVHLRHRSTSDLRIYYYDNNANPLDVNGQRLYAWDTRFYSIALRQDLDSGTRLLAQWMGGSSEMGDDLIGIDFHAYYLMLSHRLGKDRFSLRYDGWDIDENDRYPRDPNASCGDAWTVAWRRDLSRSWQLGLEYVHNNNRARNRATVGEGPQTRQRQWLGVIQYRF